MKINEIINESSRYSTRRKTATDEDYDPNGPPPGPEFRPTMPAGTARVDVSDVYDWYKLGQHISNLKGLGKHDFGKGAPSTIIAFGDENTEHKYIRDLEKTGLTTTDIDPVDPNQPRGMKRQKVDPTFNVSESAVDYMRGHCHVMASALKKLHPDWKLRAHIGWDEDTDDDNDYRVDHIYIVAPDGSAYDCRGKFSSELELIGPSEPDAVETQIVDYGLDDLKYDVKRGELKPFNKNDLTNALAFAKKINESNSKSKITFSIKKGKSKFSTTMTVDGKEAGVYQYDAVTGRSIAEIFPEFRGQGHGKLLVLNAIYTAAKLGMDFQEDDARTAAYDNVLDSLSNSGYIVDDDGYWYVTGEGEQYLKRTLTEASGYIPSQREKNDWRFKSALTVDVTPDSIKKNAKLLGLGNIQRSGIPPTAKTNGAVK